MMHNLTHRIAARHIASMSREACIIAAGEFGGVKCLFKNRDRNYKPEIRIYHEMLGGTEVLYMKDETTGWCEGINEYGIGIVNAALAVREDEKQGKASKAIPGKGKNDHTTINTLKDGKRVLKALESDNIEQAVGALQSHLGGLRGHTLIADKDTTYSLEATWRGHDFHVRRLPNSLRHVRTNHGQFYDDAGYTEKDGDNYLSSLARRDQAMRTLREVEDPEDIAPSIYGRRRPDRRDPLNMVKLTDGMRTTSQMVLNLKDMTMLYYIVPGQLDYLGYKKNLPKGHTPKLKLEVFEYTDLDEDGKFDTVKRKRAHTGMRPLQDPAFNLREVAKHLLLLEDHLMHGDRQCPDCIWKHLLTAEAFADEADTLGGENPAPPTLAADIRALGGALRDGVDMPAIGQQARRIRKSIVPTVARSKTAGRLCDPYDTSHAWISPDGVVHVTPKTHEDWAMRYLQFEWDGDLNSYSYTLLSRGWIRVSNFVTLEVFNETLPSQKAWESAIDLIASCSGVKNFDPFKTKILVEFTETITHKYFTVSDFVEHFAGRKAGEAFFAKLMSRTASGGCDPTGVSFAWIDPSGELHDDIDSHEDWALEFVQNNYHLIDYPIEHISISTPSGLSMLSTLLKRFNSMSEALMHFGWIRVSNFKNIEVWTLDTPPDAAWRTLVNVVSNCVLENHRIDVFEPEITIESAKSGRDDEFSVSDFLKRFSDRTTSDRFFAKLMSRTASNACDPYRHSYAWIDPEGNVHETPNGHEYWASVYYHTHRNEMAEYFTKSNSYTGALLKLGWIRVANFKNLEVWSIDTPSQAAWEAVINTITKCVLENRGMDVFEPSFYVDVMRGQGEVYSIADFLKRFANKATNDRFFNNLMERT